MRSPGWAKRSIRSYWISKSTNGAWNASTAIAGETSRGSAFVVLPYHSPSWAESFFALTSVQPPASEAFHSHPAEWPWLSA